MLNRTEHEMRNFYIILLSGFLIPIVISCAICIILILKKKRLFQNEVGVNQQHHQQQQTGANQQNDIISKAFNLDLHLERQEKQKEEEKALAQILAAERCIKTNFLLVSFLFFMFVILAAVSKQTRVYLYVIIFSTFKAVLPLLTTIANFGTIQFVARHYWSYIKLQGSFT